MEEEVYKSLYERLFAEMVTFNIEQLQYRYVRLSDIDITKKDNQKEFFMLFDSFLALFRSLFLERGYKQYSIQNYYREKGRDEIAQKIDDYLDTKMLSWKDKSIREVLKFIADKFICHVDPINREDLALADFYMNQLMNPYADNNLQTIMESITQILNND